jgi:hypothetical protein
MRWPPHDARTTANSDKKPAETLNPAAEITASIPRSAEIEGRVIEDTYIRHMHDTAGKYHLHYSTVRTTSTSLLVPIGILASITLLVNCPRGGYYFPIALIIFIVASTLVLNMIFTRWSRACRHIERYYEEMKEKGIAFELQIHGFRNLFHHVIVGNQQRIDLPNALRTTKLSNWLDPFVITIIIFGITYLIIYVFALRTVCHYHVPWGI